MTSVHSQSASTSQPQGGLIHRFIDLVRGISLVAGILSAAMIVVAVGLTCQMIFVRFVLNESTVWQTEVIIYLTIAATLIGLSYVQMLKGHVNVDLVPMLMPRGVRTALAWLIGIVCLALALALTYYSFEYWSKVYTRGWRSGTIWDPQLWVPYLALPIGFVLLSLQYIADLLALATGREPPFGLGQDPHK